MMKNKPRVSVYMTTYYHEQYIKKAIDSVLDQKTNFSYEIVISDDASKDKTPEILKEYQKKYDFIKVNLNETNIGLTRNMFLAKSMCSGDYIIPLSGDDYWIDNDKLQKQYDFLISHDDYVGVTTVVEARADDDDYAYAKYPSSKLRNCRVTLDSFLKGNNYPLNGIMTKNFLLDKDKYEKFSQMPRVSQYIDDVTDSIFILQEGDVYVLNDSTVAYRVRRRKTTDKNFNSENKGLLNFCRHIEMLNTLDKFLDGQVDLLYRYVVVTVNGLCKGIILRKLSLFIDYYKTIPFQYRRRGLLFKVVILIVPD